MPRLAALLLCSLLVAVAATAAPAPAYRPDPDPTRWFGLRGWNRPANPSAHSAWSKTGSSATIRMPAVKEKHVRHIMFIHRDVEGDFRMEVRVRGDLRPALPGTRSAGLFLAWGKKVELSASLGVENVGLEFTTEARAAGLGYWTSRSRTTPSTAANFLRLERRDDKLFASVSPDGSNWTLQYDVKNRKRDHMAWNPPAKLRVGVRASLEGETPFEAVFDQFKLTPLK